MRVFFQICLVLLALDLLGLSDTPPAHARQTRSLGNGGVWVKGHFGPNGAWIRGYYRELSRPDSMWIEAHIDEFGIRVPGHWVAAMPPVAHRMVFEPGHRRLDGGYESGFWRRPFRVGYRWISGFYDRNKRWNQGYFKPVERRRGQRWEPGYVDPNTKVWVLGSWRPTRRAGFTWIAGRRCGAVYRTGHWRPLPATSLKMRSRGYRRQLKGRRARHRVHPKGGTIKRSNRTIQWSVSPCEHSR